MTAASTWGDVSVGFFAGVGASVVAGFILWWLFRPRVSLRGLCAVAYEHGSRTGALHKIVFELRGRSSPGWCCLEISWPADPEIRGPERLRERVFAKWDETAIPCENHDPAAFRPERVPATYFQPLLLRREYAVPIIFSSQGNYDVFSGWWYGKEVGHKTYVEVTPETELRLTLSGAGVARWVKTLTVRELVRHDRRCPELDPS